MTSSILAKNIFFLQCLSGFQVELSCIKETVEKLAH